MSEKKHYYNNSTLREILRDANEKDYITKELSEAFMVMTKRISTHPRFMNYSYSDDLQAEALYALCRSWKNIKFEDDSNPFSYITTTVMNSFKQYIYKEYRHQAIQDKILLGMDNGFENETIIADEELEVAKDRLEKYESIDNTHRANKRKLYKNPRKPRTSKFTKEEIDKIVEEYYSGEYTQRNLGIKYGVSQTTIGNLLKMRKQMLEDDDE